MTDHCDCGNCDANGCRERAKAGRTLSPCRADKHGFCLWSECPAGESTDDPCPLVTGAPTAARCSPMETALPAVDRPVGIHELREIVRRSYPNREVDDQSLGALADEIDRAMGML